MGGDIMVNLNELKKDCIVSGVCLNGKEVTGTCINIMKGFRMVAVKTGRDNINRELIEFQNIKNIK
jgi:hypothetical protein